MDITIPKYWNLLPHAGRSCSMGTPSSFNGCINSASLSIKSKFFDFGMFPVWMFSLPSHTRTATMNELVWLWALLLFYRGKGFKCSYREAYCQIKKDRLLYRIYLTKGFIQHRVRMTRVYIDHNYWFMFINEEGKGILVFSTRKKYSGNKHEVQNKSYIYIVYWYVRHGKLPKQNENIFIK